MYLTPSEKRINLSKVHPTDKLADQIFAYYKEGERDGKDEIIKNVPLKRIRK
uniref:Cytoplasmic FMR1-interacting protein 1 (Fragments) n=1 Tax=Bos taurus TaxID=9913 RepID=CYFP1_BOVIN|nr:RecName: Full=Cytoplasmic FMR1-interacting protein 1; AltName: Full=Specifically Rac1-associated protein 1; Short=Sra-1; AltName: Full=p140sra-1 [Bos taurus]